MSDSVSTRPIAFGQTCNSAHLLPVGLQRGEVVLQHEQLWHLHLPRGGALNRVFGRLETVCVEVVKGEYVVRKGKLGLHLNRVQRGFDGPVKSAGPLSGYSSEQILRI